MSQEIWFTADLHRAHKNILKFTRRGELFSCIEEHDQAILDNINKCVKPGDRFYILGDVSFGNHNQAADWVNKINAKDRFLVRGNHDERKHLRAYEEQKCFVWIKDVYNARVDNRRYWLSHYCHLVWPKSHKGVRHLYGHSHFTLTPVLNSLSMDVGLDSAFELLGEYRPFNADEIENIFVDVKHQPVDHHDQETN